MKTQQNIKNNEGMQGGTTTDRSFVNHKEDMKQKGVSNGGGQRSDQTSNRDKDRKHATRRKVLL